MELLSTVAGTVTTEGAQLAVTEATKIDSTVD